MVPQPYRVERLWRETGDTFSMEVAPLEGAGIGSFAPGQFNMLYAFGVGEVPISISGDPSRPSPLVHTVRAVGAVTRRLSRLRRGETLGVRGPFGAGWPLQAAPGRDVVLVAGGIGLAPLRPAFHHLLAQRQRYGRICLLYGARTPADLLFRRELEKWRARLDVEVEVTVDSARGGWRGHVGVVTRLVERADFDPFHAVALVCGPEVMMRFAAQTLSQRGVAAADIYLSMERNMQCGIGLCGHCQYGPFFVCRDGPVFSLARLRALLEKAEI